MDHAATTPLDKKILDAMLPYLTDEYGNADSPHAFGRKAMHAVDEARDTVAALVNAKPSEIYFTSGGTESDNWALISGAKAARQTGKNHVIISSIEHHAVLAAAEGLEKEGFSVTRLSVNAEGRVEPSALENAITENTGLVAVMAANNETGVVQPIEALATLARAKGALFFTDGVQAAPHQKIDVKEWGVDMLSFSSHKLYGPKGGGVLYIRNGVKAQGHIVGGEQERGLRGGTTNVPAVVGLAAAYKQCALEREETQEKLARLNALFLEEIRKAGGVTVNGGKERLPAILNLRIEGVGNAEFVYAMDLQGVCVAAGSACASASIKPSHVLLAMGLSEQEAKESVRISFGKHNTEAEVLQAAKIAVEIIERLRK